MKPAVRRRSTDGLALVIDSDPVRRAALGRWVGRSGFAPRAVETVEKARSELANGSFDLVLADAAMLDAEGRALFAELTDRPLPVTGVCADSPAPPFRAGQPVLSRLGRLIGVSERMQQVYDQLLRVASGSTTVFLVGDSGTGKELAAELIHGLSTRAARPFVPVNCGALPPGLVESELFGHERGSFTGADRRHAGLFERAQGGTLFLDEVTEMPLDLQVELLRVLESGSLRRVGGTGPIEVDVRVIAATNREPEEAVAAGKLRSDLLYRLLVFPIRLPPLRDRPGDLGLIARHYLSRLNRKSDADKQLAAGAIEHLAAQPWPGNVRELRNALERAFILSDEVISEASGLAPFDAKGEARDGVGVHVGMTVADAERCLILATLEQLRGDKKKTAKTLGISLKTLYTRLSVYRASARH